jgi:hypothetical protein
MIDINLLLPSNPKDRADIQELAKNSSEFFITVHRVNSRTKSDYFGIRTTREQYVCLALKYGKDVWIS